MTPSELATHDALIAMKAANVFGSAAATWSEDRATRYALRLSDRYVKAGTFHAGHVGDYLETFLRTLFDY